MMTIVDRGEGRENEIILKYESALKKYFNAKYCIALSSGTAAIIVALKAISINNGDMIIVPPTSPLCTVYPILSTGALPLFSDVSEGGFGLDIEKFRSYDLKRVKAIVEVPMWGYVTAVDKMQDYAVENKIPLILDLAHCVGSKLNGKPLSTYCDIACYSTQKNKIFSTGEGGFLLTDNEEFYYKALMYSKMGDLNGIDFGINFKLSHFQAEAGLRGLQNLDRNLGLRKQNRREIMESITNQNIVEVDTLTSSSQSYQRLVIRTRDYRNGLAHYMTTKGIGSDMEKYRIRPLYEFPILAKYKTACPNAEKMLESATTISVHYEYNDQELDYIIGSINKFKN